MIRISPSVPLRLAPHLQLLRGLLLGILLGLVALALATQAKAVKPVPPLKPGTMYQFSTLPALT